MPTLPTTFKRKQVASKPRPHRTYKTSGGTWRKIRAAHLAREPLCRVCKQQGKITPATQVDHIDGNSANNNQDNYQAICAPCHQIKSNREHGFQSKEG